MTTRQPAQIKCFKQIKNCLYALVARHSLKSLLNKHIYSNNKKGCNPNLFYYAVRYRPKNGQFYNRYYRTAKKLRNPKKNRREVRRCKLWLETACSYRVENRDEFEKLSKIVDVFIKNWMTTP